MVDPPPHPPPRKCLCMTHPTPPARGAGGAELAVLRGSSFAHAHLPATLPPSTRLMTAAAR